MANYPPYMNATGLVKRILEKIKEASTPKRFTLDFLGTKLGFTGGSAKAFIPFAKRMGILESDGSPTDLYKKFRNPEESGRAMADAMRRGYAEMFARNEYTYSLDRKKLEGLVMEITGMKKGDSTLKAICGTFEAVRAYADFDAAAPSERSQDETQQEDNQSVPADGRADAKLNLSYIINLVLPNTDDAAVFNAIFKSLRENLLR